VTKFTRQRRFLAISTAKNELVHQGSAKNVEKYNFSQPLRKITSFLRKLAFTKRE